MTQQRRQSAATVDADGEFATLSPIGPGSLVGISISGTFSGTVSLQRRFDGANWRTVQTWTAEAEATYMADAGCELRLGFATGGYGSGSVAACLIVG